MKFDQIKAICEAVGLEVVTSFWDPKGSTVELEGTPAQWQALLSGLRPEQVAWLRQYAGEVACLADCGPQTMSEKADELRQWLAQQHGGGQG